MVDFKKLPPLFIARHAETVYNAQARMQGQHRHTPLTSAGFAQAQAMGAALKSHWGARPDIAFYCSTAGRAQQTAALVCEALGLNFFDVVLDARLQEIDVGTWEGRLYSEIIQAEGGIVDPANRLFIKPPPQGEWYDAIAKRLTAWLSERQADPRVHLVISHGITSRVLRGLLGQAHHQIDGVPIASEAAQGTVFAVVDGVEHALHHGSGQIGVAHV
jgi:broad specificity phosphatase PhoE